MSSGIRPKQLSRMGEFYLQEAILDVLLESSYENHCIGAAEISRRAGIYRERGDSNMMNDAIVTGFLVKLEFEKKVERCAQPSGRGGWKLTTQEFELRRDDIKLSAE